MRFFHRISFKKKPMLLKMFLSLLLIATFTVILLMLSTFYWYWNKTADEYRKINEIALMNINVVFSNYLNNVESLTAALYQNIGIKKLMTQNELDLAGGDMNSILLTRHLLNSHNYINSIYILNNMDIVLKVANLYENDNSEQMLINMVRENMVSLGPMFWTMENRYSETRDIKTMTIFYHEGVVKGGYFSGAVISNVDLEILQNNILADRVNDKQSFYIIDSMGEIVLHSDMNLFGSDISGQPYIRKILESGRTSGTFDMECDGENTIFSYVPSDIGNFYVVSQTPSAQGIVDMIHAANVLIIIGCIIFTLMVAVSGIVSYRLYKPFGNVIHNIRNIIFEPAAKTPFDEIQFLSSAFANVVKKLNTLEKENENSAIIRLLSSEDTIDKNSLEDLILASGILPGKSCNYILAAVRVDDFREFRDVNSQEAISFQINTLSTIINEIVSKAAGCTCLNFTDDHLVLVISDFEASKFINESEAKIVLSEVQEAVYSILNISITIGISLIADDISLFPEKYKEAERCTKYKLFYGKNSVISYETIKLLNQYEIPESFALPVVEAVKSGDEKEFCHSFDHAFEICKNYSYENAIKFLSAMAVSIIELSRNIYKEDNPYKDIHYLDIHETISNTSEKEELLNWFNELSKNSSDIINDINNKNIQNILLNIIEYINQNYHDPQLSANTLADRFSISTQYFSKIFNDFTGCSLPDYVNKIRLENAKELLLADNKMDIQSIADSVGFSSSAYFSTVFKKRYGVSPSKFRLTKVC